MKIEIRRAYATITPVTTGAIDGQNTNLTSSGGYVWKDEKASFVVKSTTGASNPVWGEYIPGFGGLLFGGTAMSQVWVDFHIDHDIAMGTRLYPHVHWMPLTAGAGTVRWGFQYIIAKGHQQSAFPTTPVTVYVDHAFAAGSQYKHMVTEVSDLAAILSSEIEPDAVVKMRVFREGDVDSYVGSVHAWQADLHYQVGRIGTINKAPNFYGA